MAIVCKLNLIQEMARQNNNIAEARTLIDSIDQEKVSNNYKGIYQSAKNSLINAEAKPQ